MLFPNPFATDLTIDVLVHEPARYSKDRAAVAQPGISSVRVYDVKGRLVRSLMIDEVLHPGVHTLGWDGTDEAGTRVAAGVYYCRLRIGERSLTRRVILLR
jgi:flagellar hook assembly protein FlgD